MRIIGWILTVLGYIWAFNGAARVIAAAIGAIPGSSGTHILIGIGNLLLAALAIAGGRKLRNRAALHLSEEYPERHTVLNGNPHSTHEGAMAGDAFFTALNKAVGLKLDQTSLVHTLRLQSKEQQEQYMEALKLAVIIYQDVQAHGGTNTENDHNEWERVNKLIAFWAVMADYATPKRKGWLGRRTISPGTKLMLLRTLSSEAEIIQSGELA